MNERRHALDQHDTLHASAQDHRRLLRMDYEAKVAELDARAAGINARRRLIKAEFNSKAIDLLKQHPVNKALRDAYRAFRNAPID